MCRGKLCFCGIRGLEARAFRLCPPTRGQKRLRARLILGRDFPSFAMFTQSEVSLIQSSVRLFYVSGIYN